ncbi:sulfite exporter TauE/SafE family protein [Algihabitans albus]|uniref:sulfite exporter TauE/SafE family protein n=1 Tax=Algihabitans albus TaxID=2164067 RepID=UPI000E5D3F9D|nr:sulfite exporter TauE/SafE family protein [Algihabitans albus]
MEAGLLALVGATFLLAGFVKGVIGLGLPSISLALLTATLGLQPAIALMLVPSLATNLLQGLTGGHLRGVLRRIWPFLLCATATIWFGAMALTRIDPAVLSGLLGLLLVAYAAVGLGRLQITLSAKLEPFAGIVFGTTNGLLSGMTGSFTVPGVLYLQASGLERDQLIQAMGLLFSLSTLGLAVALGGQNLLRADLGALSAAALLPALLGMELGRRLRHRLSEAVFRRVFLLALLGLGLYLAGRNLL